MDDVSFEQWLEDYWRHPDTDLDASVAAVIDDRPVSFSHLRIAPGGRAVTDMTGTLRAYRGRGLALLAKRATLVNAANRGVELVSDGERRDERTDAQGQREPRLSARRQHAHLVAALSASGSVQWSPNRSTSRPWRRPRSLTVSESRPSFVRTVRTMQAPARITSARLGCRPTILRRSSAVRVR